MRWRERNLGSAASESRRQAGAGAKAAELFTQSLFPIVYRVSGPSPGHSHRKDCRVKIKIFCTLGPASLRADVIKGLDERGVDLFRINLSHTPPERVLPAIELVRRYSTVPICLDTQGAQVRCGLMADGVRVERGQRRRDHRRDDRRQRRALHPLARLGLRQDAAGRPGPGRLRRGAPRSSSRSIRPGHAPPSWSRAWSAPTRRSPSTRTRSSPPSPTRTSAPSRSARPPASSTTPCPSPRRPPTSS